ncbi:hypothetical protein [Streptomyces olivochromogenes]|uniref:Uncharacterized protein n=1 Tax=Streptomyces olivochromogenes TaxID=1963 RepID=A0A250VVU1_STROL|nr:hypothetical protein [Streptomyces olivochromogenes]GAX58251.1 hypothetical protein SO3561_09822 [Streptomyces olivochromogenes]
MNSYAFTLAFSQIECAGCGVGRIRGVDCPDCGHRPQAWEIDALGLARRQAAHRAQALLTRSDTPLPAAPSDTAESLHADLFARVEEWTSAFLKAAAATTRAATQEAQDLESAVHEFAELRSLVQGADDRRPLRALVNAERELVGELASMTRAYLAVLVAATPLQAQKHGEAAQRHLDRAAEVARRAGDIAKTLNALTCERDVAQIQAGLLIRALEAYEVPDLLALDKAGRDELHQLTSSRGVDGSGLLFAVNRVLAESLFDGEQFRDVLRRAYTVFRSRPDVLRQLAANPLFESDFQQATWELFDGSMEAVHAVDNAVHSRQTGRALLGIASSLVEGPGQVIATVLLLTSGVKTAAYTNLRNENATKLVSTVQREPTLHGLLDGLDNDLRTGRAHALVRYEEESAVIERKSGTRIVAWPDVVDGVFQGYESIYACQVALLQALGELGFTGFGIGGLWRTLGMPAPQMTTILLQAMNCHDVTITAEVKRWRIEARTDGDTSLPTLIAMLTPYLPDDVDKLDFRVHQNGQTHTLAGPLALFREFSASTDDEDARMMAFLRLRLTWTYDDDLWLSTDVLRRWTAIQGAHVLEAEPAAAIARLRSLRDLATLAGDDALVWALSGVIRHKRLGSSSDARAELSQLEAWCVLSAALPEWW